MGQQDWAAGRGMSGHRLWGSGEHLATALHLQSPVCHMLVGLSKNMRLWQRMVWSCLIFTALPLDEGTVGHCARAETDKADRISGICSGINGKWLWLLLCDRSLLYQLLA